MRFKTASCFEALLQIWDTWSSNRNIKSIFIPKRVTLSSHLILAESILKEVISPRAISQYKLPEILLDLLS